MSAASPAGGARDASGVHAPAPGVMTKESEKMEIAPDKYLYFTQPG